MWPSHTQTLSLSSPQQLYFSSSSMAFQAQSHQAPHCMQFNSSVPLPPVPFTPPPISSLPLIAPHHLHTEWLSPSLSPPPPSVLPKGCFSAILVQEEQERWAVEKKKGWQQWQRRQFLLLNQKGRPSMHVHWWGCRLTRGGGKGAVAAHVQHGPIEKGEPLWPGDLMLVFLLLLMSSSLLTCQIIGLDRPLPPPGPYIWHPCFRWCFCNSSFIHKQSLSGNTKQSYC